VTNWKGITLKRKLGTIWLRESKSTKGYKANGRSRRRKRRRRRRMTESGLKRINKGKNYLKYSTEMRTVQNLTRVLFLDSTKLILRIKILFRKLQMLQLVTKLPPFVTYEGVLPCLQ